MNIGFVSTWLHRGAAYVTVNYARLLQPEHNVYVYGRGGEYFDDSFSEIGIDVYKGCRIDDKDGVLLSDFEKWIIANNIDIVIWNEQRDLSVLCTIKKKYPGIVHGAYIDYYTEDMIPSFAVYDFLLCNTRRHYSVFDWHSQSFYLPWGCDINLYSPQKREGNDKIVFFHSMGMSDRKGTDKLVNVFRYHRLDKFGAKLIIHTQKNINHIITYEEAKQVGIEIIEKTVPAPGLYYKGDVYVYPAKLDGLGLTMYEAISCGLPVITSNVAPMNEVISEHNGILLSIDKYYSRSDGYYWPQVDVNENSLLEALMFYIDNADQISVFSKKAREDAVNNWNINARKQQLIDIISRVKPIDNKKECALYISRFKKKEFIEKRSAFIKLFVPHRLLSFGKQLQSDKKMKRV